MRPIEVVHLHRRDTIDVVREALATATVGAQLWLVLPWRWRLTNSLVNLKLIARAGDDNALDLRLVSSHIGTRALAREAGIPAYAFLPLGLGRFRRPALVTDGVGGSSAVGAGRRLRRASSPTGWLYRRRPRHLSVGVFLLSLVTVAAVLAGTAVVAAAILPSATVNLEPASKPISGSLTVTANPKYRAIDYAEAIIPARVVQVIVEDHGETPASGGAYVPDGQAGGQVVFANRTAAQVRVPKGTVVRTGSGTAQRYYTVADANLPAALNGTARVGIVAVDAGPDGNVRELTINVVEGDVARLVEVLNDAPTRGGSSRNVPAVAYKDFDRLRADMIKQLQQQALNKIVAELRAGEFVPPSTLETQIMSEHFDQVVDQRSDVLSMQMKVVVRGVAGDGHALNDLMARFLETRADKGLEIVPDSLSVKRSEQVQVENNVLRFETSASGALAPVVDVEWVKVALRGKEVPQAKEWLGGHLPLRGEPKVEITPPWWERLPLLPGRMTVTVSVGKA